MLFNNGNYKHENGFEISVDSEGKVMLSPNHPMSMRLSEFFDSDKWTEIDAESTSGESEPNITDEQEGA